MEKATGLQLVTPVQEMRLKELGFPRECASEGITVELAAKWLRDEKGIHVAPILWKTKDAHGNVTGLLYRCEVARMNPEKYAGLESYAIECFEPYEKALSRGIDQAMLMLPEEAEKKPTALELLLAAGDDFGPWSDDFEPI